MAEPTHLVVGHVTKPHGTKGEVFVWPLTDEPGELFVPGRTLLLGDEHGQLPAEAESLTVASARPFKRGVLVGFEGVADRAAAEPLARRYLLIPAEEARPREEDELFYHELLGMEVVTAEGESVGRVREVYETEPAHLLEVRGSDGRQHLIPFTRHVVRRIERESGRLVIEPPEGLLDI